MSWSVAPATLVRLHHSKGPSITFQVKKTSEKCGYPVSSEKATHGRRRIKYVRFISRSPTMWFLTDKLLPWGTSQGGFNYIHMPSHPRTWAGKCLLPSNRRMPSGCQVTLSQSVRSWGYVLKLLSFVSIDIDLSVTWTHLTASDRSWCFHFCQIILFSLMIPLNISLYFAPRVHLFMLLSAHELVGCQLIRRFVLV